MKTTLSIEESASLIELGVDPKLASMVSWKQTENWQRKSVLGDKEHLQLKPFRPMVMGFERFDCKDIFTLTDILSILPKEINHQCLTIISTDKLYFARYGKWEKEYIHSWQETFTPNYDCGKNSAPELIDALYSLLIWAIENNHVNLNIDKK